MCVCLTWPMKLFAIPDWQIHAHFKTLGIRDGLSQSSVTDLVQDQFGFLWIATQDGLNRYDGYEFVNYKHSPDDRMSLSDNWLTALATDHQNRLWIGTNGHGLNIMELTTGIISRFSAEAPFGDRLKKVYTLFPDSRGRLWIGTFGDGVGWMDLESGTLHWVRIPGGKEAAPGLSKIWSFAEFDGAVWAGTDSGHAIRIQGDGSSAGSVQVKGLVPGSKESESWPLRSLEVFRDRLVAASPAGMEVLATREGTDSGRPDTDLLPAVVKGEVFTLFSDTGDELWIGTMDRGLFRHHSGTGKSSHYLHSEQREDGLGGNFVSVIYRDRTGILWIGTDGGGLSRFDPSGLQFGHFSRQSTGRKLADNVIFAFGESLDGSLLIGTENNGLQAVDPESGGSRYVNSKSSPAALAHDTVRALATGPKGDLWVGTAGGGLTRLNEELTRVRHFNTDTEPALPDNWVLSLLFDSADRLWIGTYNGLVQARTEPELKFEHDPSASHSLNQNIVTSLFEDSHQRIWVGTWGQGLYRLSEDSRQVRNYRASQDTDNALSNDRIWSVSESADGRIWVGTDGGGLSALNPRSGEFRHYSSADGLPNDVVYGILPDASGSLWLSTNNGLSRFNPDSEEFTNFSTGDGIQAREFNAGAYRKLSSGELVFGGINGFNKFTPESLTTDTALPEPAITGLLLFNQPVTVSSGEDALLNRTIFATDELELDHRQNVFSLEFSGMYFANPEGMEYLYKLHNFDDDWISTQASNRRVTYTNLDGGDYEFLLKAKQANGDFSPTSKLLEIRVLPPPWQAWWAYLIYFLIAAGMVGLYVQSLRKKINREQVINRQLKSLQSELIETRMLSALGEMASSVAHGIRNPLASIRTSAELITSTESGPTAESGREIIDQVDRLTIWIKQLLAFRQDESAHFGSVNIASLLEDCFATYSLAMETAGIKYRILAGEKIADIEADPALLGQAFNNLIANAVEAMPGGGKIEVTVRDQPETLDVIFEDNGPGMDADILERLGEPFNTSKKEGLGVGLMLVKRILRRHKATLEVLRPKDPGTSFIIRFRKQGAGICYPA